MKIIIFACVLASAIARPDSGYGAPSQQSHRSLNGIAIIRDDRVHPDAAGSYSFTVETEDGISRSEYGKPLDIPENPTGQEGQISFTFPNGEKFDLSFVADGNGYQPKSSYIHPIPDFVQRQIEKAAREDAEGQRSAAAAPSSRHSYNKK